MHTDSYLLRTALQVYLKTHESLGWKIQGSPLRFHKILFSFALCICIQISSETCIAPKRHKIIWNGGDTYPGRDCTLLPFPSSVSPPWLQTEAVCLSSSVNSWKWGCGSWIALPGLNLTAFETDFAIDAWEVTTKGHFTPEQASLLRIVLVPILFPAYFRVHTKVPTPSCTKPANGSHTCWNTMPQGQFRVGGKKNSPAKANQMRSKKFLPGSRRQLASHGLHWE